MRERGHSAAEIARKTGLSAEYVNGVACLIEKGEQRLLRSVESRTIPISVAVEIAEADDHNVQRALQTAYEKGLLRGRKLLAAKRLVEARRRRGKSLASREARPSEKLSATALVRAYQEDAERKRDMIRRANMAKDRLMLITEALRRLSKDAPLMAIIQAEKLDTMPEKIAARLGGRASA
ncbi:plasmid partitioning protein RepB C-terminal domain-containing protein [Sphingomonas bacterium]|uniref:plasmid partitioning protein RepB C-terminal domain-containing protein n=1 Tax=Sphingomonas bacterium TaxID=1895847 RepID=UPI0020C61C24|nr:plasmid partitioning protein RepB C-terminal domain-containing protein [Sphingomonas bacterium]